MSFLVKLIIFWLMGFSVVYLIALLKSFPKTGGFFKSDILFMFFCFWPALVIVYIVDLFRRS